MGVVGAALCAAPATAAAAEPIGSQTFNYTGGEQTFVVPEGVFYVTAKARGAQGGTYRGSERRGLAAVATATIAVQPGETLYVEVGGQGGDVDGECGLAKCGKGGWNGGGQGGIVGAGDPTHSGAGGGGASDVRTISIKAATSETLGSRQVVAAGGGGVGGPPINPEHELAYAAAEGGFEPFDLNGAPQQDGQYGEDTLDSGIDEPGVDGQGGKGASERAGGAAGAAATEDVPADLLGEGTLGDGGEGGAANFRYANEPTSGAGGGGGGGVYGGGGGGGGGNRETARLIETGVPDAGGGGGGGAGSSKAPGGSVVVEPRGEEPNGQVILSWGFGSGGNTETPTQKEERAKSEKEAAEKAAAAKAKEEEEKRKAEELPPPEVVLGTEQGPAKKIKVRCTAIATVLCRVKVVAVVGVFTEGANQVAITARRGRRRRIRKNVIVAEASLTLAGGHAATTTLSLNAAGRRLLARHHKLPAAVTVTSTEGGKSGVVLRHVVTFTPRSRKHRR